MMKKTFITAIAATLCIVCGAQTETMPQLTKRVFDRARVQFKLLEDSTPSDKAPYTYDDCKTEYKGITGWTSGFFPGSLWFVYQYTGDEVFRTMAFTQTNKLSGLCGMKTHHDIGFQINCSAGNAYRMTGDEYYLRQMKDAAVKLSKRYSPVTRVIKSWDNPKWEYPVIIDNMMNLELLMVAGRLCGIDSLRSIACTHAYTTLVNHFRNDGSCYHLVAYNPLNGKIAKKQTVQGFSDASCWSRGESWGLYGYTMMYRETGNPLFLAQARRIAAYIIPLLPEDGVPEWDFNAPGTAHAFGFDAKGAPKREKYLWKEGEAVFRDASAGAVMASAFTELGWYVKGDEAKLYRATAEKILRTLASEKFLSSAGSMGGFLLKHSAANVHGWSDVDNPQTYADYYFLEALLKYAGKLKCENVKYNNTMDYKTLFEGVGATPAPCTDWTQVKKQCELNPEAWKSASEFLKGDLKNVAVGKHPLEGGAFANVQEYTSKDVNKYEYHENFIDIQYVISGKEQIGICPRENLTGDMGGYNPDKDCALFEGASKADMVKMAEGGCFTVLFPNEAHCPGLKDGENAPIKKVVVKIPYVK